MRVKSDIEVIDLATHIHKSPALIRKRVTHEKEKGNLGRYRKCFISFLASEDEAGPNI